MKRSKKLLSLVMMTALGAFALAGCGGASDDTAAETSAAAEETTKDTARDDGFLIGEVNLVSEDSLKLEIYESEEKTTSAVDVDASKLSATGKYETVTLAADVVVERIEDGVTQTVTPDAITVGDMVVISEDEGQHVYIILSSDFTTESAESAASGTEAAVESGTTTGTDTTDSVSENTDSVTDENGTAGSTGSENAGSGGVTSGEGSNVTGGGTSEGTGSTTGTTGGSTGSESGSGGTTTGGSTTSSGNENVGTVE